MSCWRKVLSYVREKYRLEKSLILRFWSDGCSGQFRSRFVFFLLSRFELEHAIFWYYTIFYLMAHGRWWRHHKPPSLSWCQIGKSFHKKRWTFRSTRWCYFKWYQIALHINWRGPEGARRHWKVISQNWWYIRVHKIARSFSTDGACKLEFFKTAVENNHFMYNITRRMGIQMFVLTLSFPCAIILIKSVLSAMVFIPKIRSGWSAIYVINGFIKNDFSFRFPFFFEVLFQNNFCKIQTILDFLFNFSWSFR